VRSPKLRRAIISLAKGLSDQADVEEAEAAAAEPARAPRREARTRWRRRA